MRIFGFAGFSGSGKTTLIEKLVPLFTGRSISALTRAKKRAGPGRNSASSIKPGNPAGLFCASVQIHLLVENHCRDFRGIFQPFVGN
jgi:ABC-type dipeptide/oligopeptide/nickel transport system ATPase subunit